MSTTVDQQAEQIPEDPETIPMELLGKWLAWDSKAMRILAHADTLDQLVDEVERLGIENPVYQKVPSGPFIGAGWR